MTTVDVVVLDDAAGADRLRRALGASMADVVVLTDGRGRVDDRAAARLAEAFADPSVAVAYSDEAVTDRRGRHLAASYKPDWSPERLRSQWYLGDLLAIRRSAALGIDLGEHRGVALRWDLVLRLTEHGGTVAHLPELLYSRDEADPAVRDRHHSSELLDCARVVQAHCDRTGIRAQVEIVEPGNALHVRRAVDPTTKVSLVIPTRGSSGVVWGQERIFVIDLVHSIVERATWPNLEFVVVADTDTPEVVRRALASLCDDRLAWVDYEAPFNFSDKINCGRAAATGEVLLLLNDDMEVIAPDFVEELVGLALDPDVGAVGAKLLLADGRLQHIGHRYADGTFHLFAGHDGDFAGPDDMCTVTRECIGVTAACLAIRSDVFDAVGGMSIDFPNNFNDVDFCLRLHDLGLRNLVTPHAVLFHFESVTRDAAVTAHEADLLFSRWGAHLAADPHSNPNLESGRIEWIERGGR